MQRIIQEEDGGVMASKHNGGLFHGALGPAGQPYTHGNVRRLGAGEEREQPAERGIIRSKRTDWVVLATHKRFLFRNLKQLAPPKTSSSFGQE
jgi:hypothetical protein